MARPKIEGNDQPASRTEILEALNPYITNGPSGLKAVIGTSKIILTREGRKHEFNRDAAIDTLIDAAVELTGPLTEKEVLALMAEFPNIEVKVTDSHVILKYGKIVTMAVLDVPLAHIRSVALELMSPKERLPQVLGAGGVPL